MLPLGFSKKFKKKGNATEPRRLLFKVGKQIKII